MNSTFWNVIDLLNFSLDFSERRNQNNSEQTGEPENNFSQWFSKGGCQVVQWTNYSYNKWCDNPHWVVSDGIPQSRPVR